MHNAIKGWAQNYAYISIGLPANMQEIIENEKHYTALYNEYLTKPLNKIVAGADDVDNIDLNTMVVQMSNTNLENWVRVLKYISELDDQNWADEKSTIKRLTKAVEAFRAISTPITATVGGTDFTTYLVKGKPVDTQLTKPFFYKPEWKVVPKGEYLKVLTDTNPCDVTDLQRNILKKAKEFAPWFSQYSFTKMSLQYIDAGEVKTKVMTAISEELPPYEISSSIKLVTPAMIQQYGNVFVAMKCLHERGHFSFSNVGLDYLKDIDTSKVSATDVDFNTDDTVSGTLDEIINDYCKEYGISGDCTIQQLIKHICYECTIEPITVEQQLQDLIDRNKMNPNTTFDEFINHKRHNSSATYKQLRYAIENNQYIPTDIKSILIDTFGNKPKRFTISAEVVANNKDMFEEGAAPIKTPVVEPVTYSEEVSHFIESIVENAYVTPANKQKLRTELNRAMTENRLPNVAPILVESRAFANNEIELLTKERDEARKNWESVKYGSSMQKSVNELETQKSELEKLVIEANEKLNALTAEVAETERQLKEQKEVLAANTQQYATALDFKLARIVNSMLTPWNEILHKYSLADRMEPFKWVPYAIVSCAMRNPDTDADALLEDLNGYIRDSISDEEKSIIQLAIDAVKET